MLSYLLTSLLLISVTQQQQVTERSCSQGDLGYLCDNFQVCTTFDLIDQETYDTLCAARRNPAEDQTTEYQLPTTSTTRQPVEGTTRDARTPPPATTDEYKDVTDVFTSDTGIITIPYTTDNRVMTVSDYSTRDKYTLDGSAESDFTFPPTTQSGDSNEQFFGTTQSGDSNEQFFGVAPKIIIPPVNTTVAPGGTAGFNCKSTGAPTPQTTITKREETTPLNRDAFPRPISNVISETTIRQEMDNIVKSNEGWYTCMACNPLGCEKADAYLRVLDLCKDVQCPEPLVCVGDYENLTHQCECPDFCDQRELTTPDFVCSNYCETKFNRCQMLNDACQEVKMGVEVAYEGYCERTYQPTFDPAQSTSEERFDLESGEQLTLRAVFGGSPQPTVAWYREGEEERVLGTGEVLQITVNSEDSGVYYAVGTNCMNNNVRAVEVEVNVAPLPTSPPLLTTTPFGGPDNLELESELARSTCQVFGDAKFITYDQNSFNFVGQCDYVLAMDCERARWFVYGRLTACGFDGSGSCLESVTLYFDSEIVEVQRGWLVNHFGTKVSPKNTPNQLIPIGETGDLSVYFDGSILTVEAILSRNQVTETRTDISSLKILWDGYLSVEIQSPFDTMTCGACGDNDGDATNDFVTRRSGIVDSPTAFLESWKIDRYGRCEDAEEPRTAQEICGEEYEAKVAECQEVFENPMFGACGAHHDSSPFLEKCVYDECMGQMGVEELPPKCMAASAYAMRCGNKFWMSSDPNDFRVNNAMAGWEKLVGCPDADEKYQPILDTGCPQPDA